MQSDRGHQWKPIPGRAIVVGVLGVLLVAALLSAAAPAQTSTAGAPPSLALPDGEGKALVERACGGCHDPSLVMFTREDEEGWAVIVQDMAARGAKGTEEELRTITGYLAAHFSRTSGPLLTAGAKAAADAVDDRQRFEAGRVIYQSLCVGCHQADGRGREKIAPPLAGSDLVLAQAGIPVRIMLHGKRGPANVMPALGRLMNDGQIAAVLTYIRREWGHTASVIDPAAVKEVRAATTGRARPWTADELRQATGQSQK
jgi:mono/diheme cytochrome c family protein